jgi:hypothetical protein
MAFFPGTPKLESRNCPRLESWNFGSTYISTAESNQDEVWTKVVKNTPMQGVLASAVEL